MARRTLRKSRVMFLVCGLLVLAAAVGMVLWLHRGTPLAAAKRFSQPLTPVQRVVVAGLRNELTWGTGYDARYCRIPYPGGDVPRTMGACTDVVVRAYRNAGVDLQRLIHEDMVRAWKSYPRYHGLAAPDPNIDHRRVPNQAEYFKRHWITLPTNPSNPKDWQPGDVVEWKVFGRFDHTGVLCDDLDRSGFPFVIHNIGNGPSEEDVLRALGWTITGHFRYPKALPVNTVAHRFKKSKPSLLKAILPFFAA